MGVAYFGQNKRVSALTSIKCAGNRKSSYGLKGVSDVCCQDHASNTLPCLSVEEKYSMMLNQLNADVVCEESGTRRSSLHCLSCLTIANIPLNSCCTATAHPLQGWILTRSTLVCIYPWFALLHVKSELQKIELISLNNTD